MDKSKQQIIPNDSLPADTKSNPATSDLPQEAKARRKPRKLALRNAQNYITPPATANSKSSGVEIQEAKETSLDLRVSTLESEYRKLHRRTNSNTVEIGKLQASTRTVPDTSTGDTPRLDKIEPSPEENEIHQMQVDSTSPSAEKSGNPHPVDLSRVEELSDEEIETIPRSAAPAIGGPAADQNRSVALKGSYKIPLPSTLSTDDVRAVQSGLAAASAVAREIATAMRGGRSGNDSVLNETRQENRGTGTIL